MDGPLTKGSAGLFPNASHWAIINSMSLDVGWRQDDQRRARIELLEVWPNSACER
jgi:hypothetical protein